MSDTMTDNVLETLDAPSPEPTPTPESTPEPAPPSESGDLLDRLDSRLGSITDKQDDKAEPEPEPKSEPTGINPDTGKPVPDEVIKPEDRESEPEPTPKADYKWAEMRKENESYKTQVQDMETKMSEMQKRLAAFDVESTEEYQSRVTQPAQQLQSTVERMAEDYGVNPKEILDAITAPNRRQQSEMLESVAEDWPTRDKNKLFNLADQYEGILEVQKGLRENASEAMAALQKDQESRSQAMTADRKANYEKARDEILPALTSKLNIFSGDEGEKLQSDLGTIVDSFAGFPSERDEVMALYAVQLLPEMAKQNSSQALKIQELENTIKQMKGTVPDSRGTAPTEPAAPKDDERGFLEGIESHFRRGV